MNTQLDRYQFVKPTKSYRKYRMLDYIRENEQVSQRALSEHASISTSVANQYLSEFLDEDLIRTEEINRRDVRYELTEKGKLKWREDMVGYIRETLQLFSGGKKEIGTLLKDHQKSHDLRNLLFYSAGEVTELLIHALEYTDLNLLAVVDDDPEKQGDELFGYPIIEPDEIQKYDVDAIMITTFQYREQIREQLERRGYEEEHIVLF